MHIIFKSDFVQDIFFNLTTAQWIGLSVLTVALLVQLIYYLFIYLKVPVWEPNEVSESLEPISVIICARNEAENLAIHLPKVLEQDYPDFEVIVVNDCSGDDTEMLLAELKLKYRNLRSTTIEQDNKFSHGKKLALTIGMKAAKYERLVLTDADCYPASDQWLKEIGKSYSHKKLIVLGYGGYLTKPGFLNKLIRFDTLFIAMQYLGSAIIKRPYMGVGRNLSYNKSLFFGGKGFSSHYKLKSGDDDLFINENATGANTAVCLAKESFTRSIPQSSFSLWAQQKKRHLTTAPHYKVGDKWLLGLETFTRMLFYAGIIFLLIVKWNPWILLGFFVFRMLVQLTILKLNMNKFDEKGFWLWSPIFDLILPMIYLFFIISNSLNRQRNTWN